MANKKKAMEAYMEKIGERPLLTDEEEFQLARRIQEGDPNAVGLLVESNLRFVLSLAHQYKGQGVSLDDLVSDGLDSGGVGVLGGHGAHPFVWIWFFKPFPGKSCVDVCRRMTRVSVFGSRCPLARSRRLRRDDRSDAPRRARRFGRVCLVWL